MIVGGKGVKWYIKKITTIFLYGKATKHFPQKIETMYP